jgi:DUF2993 family protein
MGRLIRWLLTPIIILGLLFVGANLIVEHLAESKIASVLQSTFHLSSKPAVKISGFPIILNIVNGKIPRVTFDASGATFEGLTVQQIEVALVDVTAEGGFLRGGSIRLRVGAGTVQARATNAAVNAYLKAHDQNATMAFHAGRVVVRAVRSFLGRTRTLVATGTVAREGTALVFRPSSVTIDGRASPPGTEAMAKQKTTIKVQLPKLPGGIASYEVKAVEGAVAISAVLRDQLLDLSR